MKRRIKVLHVILSLDYGGTEKVVVDLANNLSRDTFETSIICMDRYGGRASELKKDVLIYLMVRKPGLSVKNFYSFYKLIKRVKPDIVHFRNFATYFWGCVVSRFSSKNCKIVYSDHSEIILNYETNERGKLFLRKLFKHTTDNFMTNSLTFKEKLVECVHIDPKNIVVIQNGVDTSKYYPMDSVQKRVLRDKFGFGNQEYIIGIVASFSPKKNISLAIKAMVDITSKLPSAILVLVGKGEQGKELKELVKKNDLSDKVHFPGLIKEVNKFLNILDLFLLPSSYGEGMPNAVLEAMAAKVPVVASDIRGNIEILQCGKRGLLFKNNDKDSLVDTVLRLANDKIFSNQIAEKAYQHVKENMSLQRMIERYENFYRAVYKGQKHIIDF
jgi:glycosyltransferase involved in cell wall biosynthesis